MTLVTLGGLELVGGGFRQAKLLLLAAYLTLEGETPRRHLAGLFWPHAADPMNSLSVALRKLRGVGHGGAHQARVGAPLECHAA